MPFDLLTSLSLAGFQSAAVRITWEIFLKNNLETFENEIEALQMRLSEPKVI
jgi:hypothetical protein